MLEEPIESSRLATWVPTVIVTIALVASLVVPFVAYERIEELRRHRESLADPAHAQINQLMVSLTLEISSFRGYLLTGDEDFIRRYRDAGAAGEEARRQLEIYMPAIDGGSSPHLQRINLLLRQWHESHQELFEGRLSREEYIATHVHRSQTRFAEIAGELALMRKMVQTFDSTIRRDTMRTVRTGAIAMAALVLLGLIAAMYVARLSFQLQSYSRELARRNREEAGFVAAASRLNAAANVAEVLRQVSESVTEITRADGAYVERILPGGHEVEVIANVGEGTPRRGIVVEFPGSLTAEMAERREAVVVTSLAAVGTAMAPYLEDSCNRCEIILVPLVSEDELMGALVVLAVDPKAHHFAEKDVRRARILGELAAVAMRRAAVLESEQNARRVAEEAVVAREEIVGIVSHDLRAPLTTISLGLQVLEHRYENDEIRVLRDAARRMQRLVDDLLDIARMEQGRFSLKKTAVEPSKLIADTCRAFTPSAEQKKIEIACHAAGQLPPLDADPDRLIQVLGNLISNAIKFTPDGGRIDIEATRSDDAVLFSVTDTGPGIAEKDIPNVFRRNWQAKKTAYLGAGLGLAIAKGIVEAHGGSIDVDSPPGSGARFFFTIPTART